MSSFSLAVNTIFANPVLSQPATYTPVGGSAVAVRVVKASPRQQEAGLFQTHVSVTPYVYDVRVSEVVTPKDGDVLVVGTDSFKVSSYEKDEEQLVWRLNLDKA